MSARKRRPHMRATAGLIVEGDAEFIALPQLATKNLVHGCPPVRAINLGGVGSDILPVGVARKLRPKILQHRAAGRRPIVVCIDREQRTVSATEFAAQIMRELATLVGAITDVHVCIADRAFEAWLLADARGLHRSGLFKRPPTFFRFEGELGKQRGKGVIELTELLGRTYVKTTDGPRLFAKLDFPTARKHGPRHHGSRSLDMFLTSLGV